jgi:ABC-2 type transport system permease protein
MKNLKVWRLYTLNSFQQILANKAGFLIFIPGKIIRLVMFFIFLNLVFSRSGGLGNYTGNQAIFFYLSFNLIDTASQLLFREVYRFRPLLVSGDFDFVLTKPLNPLVRVLLGGADLFDLIMLVGILFFTVIVGNSLHPSLISWIIYFLLIINGLLLSLSFHLFVLGLGIRVLTVDHLIMIYRDLTSLMRIPVDLYVSPLRQILTFVIPIGIMFSYPPQALMRLLSFNNFTLALALTFGFLFLSFVYWRRSLNYYQSASS